MDPSIDRHTRALRSAEVRRAAASGSSVDACGKIGCVRHVFECPLRRADLHPGGYVNNVIFADYLQEARLELLRHHDTSVSPEPGEGLVVVRASIEYLNPLRLDRVLVVETWVTEVRAASFTLGYELYSEVAAGDRLVHARATTVLTPFVFTDNRPRRLTPDERARLTGGIEPAPIADRERMASWGAGGRHDPIRVRFSDIDVLGHVNNVRYLEFVQDATTNLLVQCFGEAAVDGHVDAVVARTDIDYVGQLNLRPEPYDVWTRVADLGRTSVTFECEIRDGDRVMARARTVEVSLDDDRRPRPFIDAHREAFERHRADAG